jgi:hypothetical protein
MFSAHNWIGFRDVNEVKNERRKLPRSSLPKIFSVPDPGYGGDNEPNQFKKSLRFDSTIDSLNLVHEPNNPSLG